MSEIPQCPYCGAILWDGEVEHTDEGTNLICNTCARSYVYISGYGSFALSDLEKDGPLELPVDGMFLNDKDLHASKEARFGKACFTLCCILSSFPFVLIMIIMILVSIF